jgi:serine/threonine protein kinase
MATVFLGRDLRHDRPVAIKVLHPSLAAGLGPERFVREIRLAARLQHPHILGVLDSGEAEGLLWFTMPYVKGEISGTGWLGSARSRWKTPHASAVRPRPPSTTPTASRSFTATSSPKTFS